ncbi:MAG: DUF6516 family protein [Anaerolineae bacterium]
MHQYLTRLFTTIHSRGDLEYDNAPHHPELETFPDHKHSDDEVVATEAPDLHDVLQEINGILYPAQTGE